MTELVNFSLSEEDDFRRRERQYAEGFKALEKESEQKGIPTKGRYSKKGVPSKNRKRVKSKDTVFTVVYRVELGMLIDASNESNKKKIGKWELAFILRSLQFLDYPSNQLIINNMPPTIDELAVMMGCKANKISEILRNLEYFDVIKKRKAGRNVFIYLNPFFSNSGIDTTKETYYMFSDSIYNKFD